MKTRLLISAILFLGFSGLSGLSGPASAASSGAGAAGAPPAPMPLPGSAPAISAASGYQVGLMTLHGGGVLHSLNVYTVFWDPNGTGMTAPYRNLINQFYADISGTSTLGIIQQYPDTAGKPTDTITLAGTFNDTSTPFPGGEGSQADPVTENDIVNELVNVSSAQGWAMSPTNELMMFLPEGIYSSAGSAESFVSFCAYHSSFWLGTDTATQYPFALMMDDGNSVCALSTSYAPTTPNGDRAADSTINSASHELFETMTDPYYNVASGTFRGWYFSDLAHEIGDQCNYYFGPNHSAIRSDGSDVTFGADRYLIQEEWSNLHAQARGVTQAGGCALTALVPTSLKAAPAIVTVSPLGLDLFTLHATLTNVATKAGIAGQTVTFSAGATKLCSSTTNASGTATCAATARALQIVTALGYTARFAGTPDLAPSSATGALIG